MRDAWVLNLDAEDELAALRAGRRFVCRETAESAASAGAREALARSVRRLGGSVLPEDGVPPGATGLAWMPTPSALAALAEAGAEPARAPAARALILANARETARGLALPPDLGLPRATTARDIDELEEALAREGVARAPGVGRRPAWLVRPSLTSAGRARLVHDAGADPGPRVRAFAAAHLPAGPLDVAPLVDITREFAVHGWLEEDGTLHAGRPLVQEAEGGAWRRTRASRAATDGVAARLGAVLEAAAAALAAAGYFGPFGVDACAWLDGDGEERLHAPMEINARFSMGWSRSGLARRICHP